MNFQDILESLRSKEDFSTKDAEFSIRSIMDDKFSDEEKKNFLLALNDKGVTPKVLSTFVKVLREYAVIIKPDVKNLVDTCGTGGDKKGTFNISTTSAFVLAGAGVNVAKHGNIGVSSGCGSANLLEHLGINIRLEPEKVKACIENVGIGFMFAQAHHPAFKNIAHIRKELGVRTIFNMLGPLLNPANAQSQVIGVYDKKLTVLYCETLKILGKEHAMVLNGNGIDEITIDGATRISELKDDNIKTFYLDPKEFNVFRESIDDIKVKDAEESAKIFLDVLNGIKSSARDIVVLNSAAGLIVGGVAKDFSEGIKLAKDSIDSGKALKKFEQMKGFTNDT